MQPRPGKRFKSVFRVIQRRHGRGTAAPTHHQLHSAAVEDLRVDLRQERCAEDEIMRHTKTSGPVAVYIFPISSAASFPHFSVIASDVHINTGAMFDHLNVFLWARVQQRPPCSRRLLTTVQTGVCVCVSVRRGHTDVSAAWCHFTWATHYYIKVIIC